MVKTRVGSPRMPAAQRIAISIAATLSIVLSGRLGLRECRCYLRPRRREL